MSSRSVAVLRTKILPILGSIGPVFMTCSNSSSSAYAARLPGPDTWRTSSGLAMIGCRLRRPRLRRWRPFARAFAACSRCSIRPSWSLHPAVALYDLGRNRQAHRHRWQDLRGSGDKAAGRNPLTWYRLGPATRFDAGAGCRRLEVQRDHGDLPAVGAAGSRRRNGHHRRDGAAKRRSPPRLLRRRDYAALKSNHEKLHAAGTRRAGQRP